MRDDCSLFFKEYTIVRVQEFRGENYYLSFNQECEIRAHWEPQIKEGEKDTSQDRSLKNRPALISLVVQTVKICLQCGRSGFNPWVKEILWRREWQPTPVFLPGESHGQRSLVGYSPWGCKESDMTEQLTHLPWLTGEGMRLAGGYKTHTHRAN